MDSRRVMRFLVGFALVAAALPAGTGCSYLPYAAPDIGSAVANPVHNFWFRHKLDVAADDAWRKVVDHCAGRTLSSGYAEGFHTGYVDYVEGGGDGIPPTAPPYCMRCDVLRSPERQQLIIDYYAGYKQGADVAKFEGLRDLVVVPLGRPPQNSSVGARIDYLPKNDPRQPDPYGPQLPAPPGFNDEPKGLSTFVPNGDRNAPAALAPRASSIAPQPTELPTPRVAPNPPPAAPNVPAVPPMPTPLTPTPTPPKVALPVPPVTPAPTPLDPNKLPRLQPEPPEAPMPPMPDQQSRLRSSQSPIGNGSPRPMPVVPPAYVPVPIAPPPTVVPVIAMPGEEAEPPAPRPTVAPAVLPNVKPVAETPITLPELPAAVPAETPVAPSGTPVVGPRARPLVRPLPLPVAEPVEGPVTGTAEGLDDEDDDQPGETRGTTSTRDLDGLRPSAAPSPTEDDDDR
jgi:hypothetical protein